MKKKNSLRNEKIERENKIKEIIKNRKRRRFQRRLELLREIRNSNKNRTLLSNEESSDNPTKTVELPLEDIIPDPNQPRKDFDNTKIKELAESIEQHGLLQPILVRPIGDGKFEIIHGERRWRACKLAGKKTILAQVRDISDKEKIEIQLVENLQRQDLNPIEEAETFQRLIDEFGYTHEELGNRIGKSREYVTNKLRLLNLSPTIQEEVRKGSISEGHARAILSLKEPHEQAELAKKVIDQGLKVKDTEQLVRVLKEEMNVSRETSDHTSSDVVEVRDLAVYQLILSKERVSASELLSAYLRDLRWIKEMI